MADLLKAVTHTVDPKGIVTRYERGMLLKQKTPTADLAHKINVWRRWLSILKAKYHWTDELKQHLYED